MIEGKKKTIVCILFAALITSFFLPTNVYGNNAKLKTYIIYDSPTRFGSNYPLVTALIEYLGHFDLACQAISLEAWHPGTLQDAELVVFVGLKDTPLPQELMQEIARAKRIIWFEKNIEQMAAFLRWQDFKLEGVFNGWSYANYNKDLLINDWMNVVITEPGQQAQVLAVVKNAGNSKTLAWQRDNVYFCGFIDVVDPSLMIILANLLHQFVPNNNHTQSHNVLLRIEDVSPLVNPKAVSAVIAAINKYRIPFAIGVIPVGVTENEKHIYLHEKQELVKVLKEAQDNGASIIMHGYTHQNEYSPKTGEGYEFWNARNDKPMENDETFTSQRIEAGIAELVRCGLTPVAFEPPHYAMSATGYKVLSRYFNVFSGEIQISDKSSQISLALPYVSESAYLNGMLVIPENMGYYDGKSFLVEHMLQNSEQMLNIPDGFACFFYHGYLPPDKLPSIIEGVRRQGYEFFDLRQLPFRVQSPHISILGQNGQINVTIDEKLQASWRNDSTVSNIMEKVGTAHVSVLLLIIGILIAIIINLRANASRHYER